MAGSFAVGCASSASDGQQPLGKVTSTEPLGTAIVASRLVTLEDAVFDQTPAGGYAAATSRGHHLLISESTGAFVGGYGPRAYVFRDDRNVNPQGTELAGKAVAGFGNAGPLAINSGTHWLALVGSELSVLDLDGNLVASRTLPFTPLSLVWGGDRALVLGSPADPDSYSGVQQGLFVDDSGQALGNVFDVTGGATLLKGGVAFDGAHFLVQYSTAAGAFVVALSSSGDHGAPVQIASDGQDGSYGVAIGVVSDGQHFLVAYARSSDDPSGSQSGPHYRIATVDDALGVTVSDQQIAAGLNSNVTRVTFVEGRYLLSDYYNAVALSVGTDGNPQGAAFSFNPFPSQGTVGFAISADADGTSPIAYDPVGDATRIGDGLAVLDNPPLAYGLGPAAPGVSGATFDGDRFQVEWQDTARDSVRSVGVNATGTVVAPGTQALGGANAAASGRWMASNGSSVLRLLAGSSAATLTKSDGAVVSVDLSALALGPGYDPKVATDGTNYLVASSNTNIALALVAPDGTVTRTTSLNAVGAPNAVFDGTQWLVATGAYGQLDVTPVSADLTTPGTTQSLLTVPGDDGTWVSIASNGSGSFIAWLAHLDDQYQVYGSRLSTGLTLLDAPGVLLGTSYSWNPPSMTSDGTNYWVAWPAGANSAPAVRRIASEATNGNILLDTDPFVLADPPMGWATLAAQPGGPVLLVENPYGGGPVLERVLTVGDPGAGNVVGAGL
ncbi:MAG TPA: hypothetical protein VMI54_22640 [Polyangiaceae bacterium]|nr:hypothetical protein [Polyangiaceae bacterium]